MAQTRSTVLPFDCIHKILWCDHSNKKKKKLSDSIFAWYNLFFKILQNEIWDASSIFVFNPWELMG